MKGDPSRLFCGGPQVVAGNGSDYDGASSGPADCACTGVSRVARTVHDPLRCIPESSTPARASSFRTHRRSDRIAGIWHGVALPQSLPGRGRAHAGQDRQDVAGIGALDKRRVDLAVCAVPVSVGARVLLTPGPLHVSRPCSSYHHVMCIVKCWRYRLVSSLSTRTYRPLCTGSYVFRGSLTIPGQGPDLVRAGTSVKRFEGQSRGGIRTHELNVRRQ